MARTSDAPPVDRLLYRVEEVAKQLNVSRPKVYELLTVGGLPSVKIDRTRLVRATDLRSFVDALPPSVPRDSETREGA